MAEDLLKDQQNEEYMKLREQGVDKLEAARMAAPPAETQERANEAAETL